MHEPTKLGPFMALRANGWSLAKISKELNIPKSTLWDWDNKHQDEIHLLKHLQLERLQEKFLPSYEEELSQLHSYLQRVEDALAEHNFKGMAPEFLLQMALQLRGRLGKMRERVPLRNVPFNTPLEPLPFTDCVTRQNFRGFQEEYCYPGDAPEPSDASASPTECASACSPNEAAPQSPGRASVPASHTSANPDGVTAQSPASVPTLSKTSANGNGNGHATSNGKSHRNGNGTSHLNSNEDSADLSPSARPNSRSQNRTFPDEMGGGSENRALNNNNLQP